MLLRGEETSPKIVSRLFNLELVDLENKETFEGLDEDIMVGFVNHFIK